MTEQAKPDRSFDAETDMIFSIGRDMVNCLVADGTNVDEARRLIGSTIMGLGVGFMIAGNHRAKCSYEWSEQVVAVVNQMIDSLPKAK